MYSLLHFFFFGYEKCLLSTFPHSSVHCLPVSLAPLPQSFVLLTLHFLHSKVNILSLSQQVASRVESTLTQETCNYYVTIASLHHTLFQPLSFFILSFLFFSHSTVHGDITVPLFVFLSLFFPVFTLLSICSVWIHPYSTLHPLRLSLSLQRQAMNI